MIEESEKTIQGEGRLVHPASTNRQTSSDRLGILTWFWRKVLEVVFSECDPILYHIQL